MSVTHNLCVVGAGYVGLTSAACFAQLGHQVCVLEIDEERLATIQAGESPIYEAGLDALVSEHVSSGAIVATNDPRAAVEDAEFVFICVPTPSDDDGSADLSFLRAAVSDVAPHLRAGSVIINKSTVPVGTTVEVAALLGRTDVAVASNPEFLREGSAVDDFMHPDRIVVGCADPHVAASIASLYGDNPDTAVVLTDPTSAELIKYAANAYLATRLAFVNSVAQLCDLLGGDIAQVAHGLGLDRRIGPSHLRPGPGFGGSCFPKDIRALASMSEGVDFEFKLLNATIETNDDQFDYVADRVISLLGDQFEQKRVAALGLSFKAGTDDVRFSPAIEVIQRLLDRGVTVVAHDPEARSPFEEVRQFATVEEAAADCDLLVVLTEWPQYSKLDPSVLGPSMKSPMVLDTRGVIDRDAYLASGFHAEQLGRRASSG